MTEGQSKRQAYTLPDIPQNIQRLVEEYKAEALDPVDLGIFRQAAWAGWMVEWAASVDGGAELTSRLSPIASIYEGRSLGWRPFEGRADFRPSERLTEGRQFYLQATWREPQLVTYGPMVFLPTFTIDYGIRSMQVTVSWRALMTGQEASWHPVGIDELMLDAMLGEPGRYTEDERSEMRAALEALADIVYACSPDEMLDVYRSFAERQEQAQKRQKRPYKPRMEDSRVEMTHTKVETRLFGTSRRPEMNIMAEEFDGRPIDLAMGKLSTVTQIRVTDETLDPAELEDMAGKPLLSETDRYWLNWWQSVVRDNPESRVMYGTDLLIKAGYSNPRKASQDDVRREALDVATHLTGIYVMIDAEGENRAYGDRRTVRSIKRRRFAEFGIDLEQYEDGTWDFRLTRQDIGQETPFPLLEYAEDKGEAFKIPSRVFKFPMRLGGKVRKALFYILRQALTKGVSDTMDLTTMFRAFRWEGMDKSAKHRLLAGIEKGLDYWKRCSPKVVRSWSWEYKGRKIVAVTVNANYKLLEQSQKLERAESARRSAPLLPDPDEGGEGRG